jgi:hypothetical protein
VQPRLSLSLSLCVCVTLTMSLCLYVSFCDVSGQLMEEVIRKHLGWLIMWGNVFGGLIGIVSLACGYGA